MVVCERITVIDEGVTRILYLIVVLQKNPDDTLHALGLHWLACKLKQVLQCISGVGGLAKVNVKSSRFAGFGQTQLLGWSFLMGNLGKQLHV